MLFVDWFVVTCRLQPCSRNRKISVPTWELITIRNHNIIKICESFENQITTVAELQNGTEPISTDEDDVIINNDRRIWWRELQLSRMLKYNPDSSHCGDDIVPMIEAVPLESTPYVAWTARKVSERIALIRVIILIIGTPMGFRTLTIFYSLLPYERILERE